ncbi:hypothetical protein REPUB_Repub01dG0073500 [Reevesia pubescens]
MARWRTASQILVLLSFLLLAISIFLEVEAAESNFTSENIGSCIESERKALLEFRKGLKDPSGWLSSWVGKDCCNWTGVSCSNKTGNLVKLDLKSLDVCSSVGESVALNNRSCLGGMLNPSLLNLTYLSYLDLSENNFQGIPIPEFIGSLKNLRYLDLSGASFNGKYLDLGNMKLSKATTSWLQAVNMLPSLTKKYLSGCELNGFPESLTFVNFTSLEVLDLSYNNFSSSIPRWLFNIAHLRMFTFIGVNLKVPYPRFQGEACAACVLWIFQQTRLVVK